MKKILTQFNRSQNFPVLELLRHGTSLLKTAMLGLCLVPLLASHASAAVLTGVQFLNGLGSYYTGTGVLGESFYHDKDDGGVNYRVNGAIYNGNNPFSLGGGVTVTVSGTAGSLTGYQPVSGGDNRQLILELSDDQLQHQYNYFGRVKSGVRL
jgi:hypothetical protein